MPRFPSAAVDLTGYSKTASGDYSGNSSVNMAIAHSLGRTPKAVFISQDIDANGDFWHILQSGKLRFVAATSTTQHNVTAMDSTNFYVGNAASYATSANGAQTYYWVAIG